MQCVSRQYGWITVDLVNGQLHSWNNSTAHKITSKGHHQSNVERTGSISTSCRIWHTALLVSGDVYIGIDLLVRSKVLSSSYEYYLRKQEDLAKPENHHLGIYHRTVTSGNLSRPTHPGHAGTLPLILFRSRFPLLIACMHVIAHALQVAASIEYDCCRKEFILDSTLAISYSYSLLSKKNVPL